MHDSFSQAYTRGARSTALHALQWALGMLLTALPAALVANAPAWLLISLIVASGTVLVVFLSAYIYLLFKNPDALRSEQYTLSKMAIERGLVGDSLTGLKDLSENARVIDATRAISDDGTKK